MKYPKARRLWPITFMIISGAAIVSTLSIFFLILSLSRGLIRERISERNLSLLRTSHDLVEFMINDFKRDMELFLPMLKELPQEKAVERIRFLLESHELLSIIHMVDSEGRVLFSVPDLPALDGFDVSSMGYYRQWLEAGGTVFHGQELTMFSDIPHSSVITSHEGVTMAAHADFKPLADRFTDIIDGTDLELSILDSAGIYIVHPEWRKVQERERNTDFQSLLSSYQGGILDTTYTVGSDIINAKTIELFDMGWYLGIFEQESEVNREVFISLSTLFPWLAAVIVLLMGVSWLAARIVVTPLHKVTLQLRDQNAGALDFRFSLTGVRDTDSLVRAMNGMLEALDARQKELVIARDAAESANQAKDQFLANMSHELLTPLNGIRGIANLLKESGIGREGERLLSLQDSAIEELRLLIADILDYARLKDGTIELETRQFNMAALIEESLVSFASKAVDKGIDFNSSVKFDTGITCTGDPLRLQRILECLVDNAVKFTEVGRVDVMASLENICTNDCQLILMIRDTGKGMAQDRINGLLQQFTLGEETYTKSFRGSGMGLTLSSMLIRLMEGHLSITSEPGKGTDVKVELPISMMQTAPSADR